MTVAPGGDAAGVIASYQPRVCDSGVAAFARDAVSACSPVSGARARSLLWACARLGAWAGTVGLAPQAAAVLHPSVIERFVMVAMSGAPMTRRRTMRTNLRFVARHVVPDLAPPEPLALARSRAKAPYSPTEIEAFFALADTQASKARTMRLSALLCLGAGAGLTVADLRHVRGHHIARRHGGLIVAVEGPTARMVPVLGRYAERLAAAAAFAGEGYVVGGVSASRHNVTNRLVSSVAGGADLARIEFGRLRCTWLATHAERLGLRALFAAAGIRHSQHIGDIVAGLGVPTEAEAVRLLGGVR